MKPLKDEIQQNKPFASIEEEVYLNILKTSDLLRNEIDKILGMMGLNHNQYNVLRILRGSEPLGLEMEEIGKRMVTKESDFSGLLEKLEGRGLIKLKLNPENMLQPIGKITNQGLDLLVTLESPLNDKVVYLLNFLGLDLLEQFNTLLVLSRKNIKPE
jgi:MarR family transcriptional regulator, organic hydroperoxide resistance regulator